MAFDIGREIASIRNQTGQNWHAEAFRKISDAIKGLSAPLPAVSSPASAPPSAIVAGQAPSPSGVTSLNKLTGALGLIGFGGIEIVPSGVDIDIGLSGDGTILTPAGASKQSYNALMGTSWVASNPVVPYWWTIDSNGNLQKCTQAGTTGGSAPTWSVILGGTTNDGSAQWTLYKIGPFTTSTLILETVNNFSESPDAVTVDDAGKTIRVLGPLGDNSDRVALDGTVSSVNVAAQTMVVSFSAPSQGLSYASAFWWPTGQDDTGALQAAINSGFRVQLARGVFVVASGPLLYSPNFRSMTGSGPLSTVIVTSAKTNTFRLVDFSDCLHAAFRDLSFFGPGVNSSFGGGLRFKFTVQSNVENLLLQNILVQDIAWHGIELQTPINSTLANVKVLAAAGHGILINGGVAVALVNCYSLTSLAAAFAVTGSFDIGFLGCAAEASGVEYLVQNSSGVWAGACDAEAGVNRVVAAPSALSPSVLSGGAIAVGTHTIQFTWIRQVVSFISETEETLPSPTANFTTTTGNQTVQATIPAQPSSLYPFANVYIDGKFQAQVSVSGSPTVYTQSVAVALGAAPPNWAYRGHGWVIDGSTQVEIVGGSSNTLPSSDCRHVWIGNGSSEVAVRALNILTGGVAPTFAFEISALGTASTGITFTGASVHTSEISGSPVIYEGVDGFQASSLTLLTALAIASGGTGAATAAAARSNLVAAQGGLGAGGGGTVTLAKLTSLGTNGSLTWNVDGVITSVTAPT